MISLPRRVALLAALSSVAALAPASAAEAAVAPPAVVGNVLTVTSDGEGDTVTLAAAAGVITVNGAPTTLPADANAQIVVNAGGGDDTVEAGALAAANYGALTLNGGDGQDTLTGGAGNDTLKGEGANDRLVGFKGVDHVFGGEGDDVMVWNNGDGTDTNDGEAGTDEAEVNGSPAAGDTFTFQPKPGAPGRVQFNRANLVKFEIDLSAERLTVNGLAGPDEAQPDPAAATGIAGLTSLTLNGGSGDDELTGGNGGDLISGGAGSDRLSGGDGADLISGGDESDVTVGDGGDDRLLGDRGADFAAGGEGDDTMAWNNGDGTDADEGGGGFDRVEVNGSPAAGDQFKLVPAGADAKLERTNLVPFAVNLTSLASLFAAEPDGGIEAVAVNGGGGNDGLSVSPGLARILLAADGGAGDDELTGAEEVDSFFGGSGNDTLAPGGGSDLADGQEGEDRLLSRDGSGDLVRGGAGTDSAQTDATTVDAIDGVEALDATPLPVATPAAGDTVALLPRVGRIEVARAHRKLIARAPVGCPAAETGGCRMTLTLTTAKAVRLGAVRAPVVLGSKGAALAPGQETTLSVRLAAGAADLAKAGRLAVRVGIASADAAGNSASRSTAMELRLPR